MQAIETLQSWMSSNRLPLNPTKTPFIWFGTRQQLAKIDLELLATKYPHFTFSSSVRDLGVTLDQELTFVGNINFFSIAAAVTTNFAVASLGLVSPRALIAAPPKNFFHL